jgi:hypothetical protein
MQTKDAVLSQAGSCGEDMYLEVIQSREAVDVLVRSGLDDRQVLILRREEVQVVRRKSRRKPLLKHTRPEPASRKMNSHPLPRG